MAERGGKNRDRQLGAARLGVKLDLIKANPGITADEAERVLVEKGLIDDLELIGREAEKRVARLIKKSPLVRAVRVTEPRSEEDLDWKDVVVVPRLKLRLLREYYIQVKSSQKWVDEFRKVIVDLLLTHRSDLWALKRGLAPVDFGKRLEKEIDVELVRRKIVVIVGGPKQTDDQILAAQAVGVKALYGYWQDK